MNDSLGVKLTFKDIMDASASNLSTGGYISIIDILIALVASLMCAFLISWMYRYTFQGVIYHKSYNISIILISMITTSVIIVISGNLMLALGMVGALSIVRFRAAIKEPLDIVFIFWAITVGIANGVAFFKLSFVSTIFFSLILYFLVRVPFSVSSYMLIINYRNDLLTDKKILDIIMDSSKRFAIQSKNIKNNNVELICEIRIKIEDSKLLQQLDNTNHVIASSLIACSNNMLDK